MRLICPNCGAQYEVDDSLIPDAGRDVQCSNCGHAWFQRPAHLDPELSDELGLEPLEDAAEPPLPPEPPIAPEVEDEEAEAVPEAPVVEPVPEKPVAEDKPAEAVPTPAAAEDEDEDDVPAAPPQRRKLDPDVRSILSEEAAREHKAREAETGLETQGDLGLPEAPRESRPAGRSVDAGRLVDESMATAAKAGAAAAASRRDLLPDIEEINSSLLPVDEDQIGPDTVPERRKSGFGFGFMLVVLIAALAILLYIFAAQIGAAVPALAPLLDGYVNWVDGIRGWLDSRVQDWVQRLSSNIDDVTKS